jgi:hypothetical protein
LANFDADSRKLRLRCECCTPKSPKLNDNSNFVWLQSELKRQREADMENIEGRVWVARRRLIAQGKAYHAGTVVPASALGRNARELERTGYVWNAPAHQPVAGLKPVDLPEPPPAPAKKPKLRLVRLNDPVASWRESYREAQKHFPSAADAMDFLMAHEEARSLYKLATATAVAREKARLRGAMQSVTPDMVGF